MAEILSKQCIVLNINGSDKNEVIKKLVDQLSEAGSIKDRAAFLKDVYDREMIHPTYIGYHIGMPHGRTENVIRTAICYGRLSQPIHWGHDHDEKVNTVVLIAAPKEDNDGHLKIISQLARNLMHEDFRNTLLESNEDEVYTTINSVIALDA
ncbi:PTS sugar transporter subunit IIA [Bacillus changyiensis]|uniref:PTS sugar transporter subunit IIA n=1 Tax=Bacillus changyiensis TaxID=3004103 RepID=UPI0022E678AF|nr:PTS sugar transporter subunit IIA [Bacillus changyiensis]MDA1477231.1 PTS sugar transporter subunit IIA [Bacillus changyiensis]